MWVWTFCSCNLVALKTCITVMLQLSSGCRQSGQAGGGLVIQGICQYRAPKLKGQNMQQTPVHSLTGDGHQSSAVAAAP